MLYFLFLLIDCRRSNQAHFFTLLLKPVAELPETMNLPLSKAEENYLSSKDEEQGEQEAGEGTSSKCGVDITAAAMQIDADVTPKQPLGKDLITLSDTPAPTWKSLMNLDIIKVIYNA